MPGFACVRRMLLAVLFLGSSTQASTFYLSPGGNDANSGRSADAPWRTFAQAFGTMSAGDELILLDGLYSESAGTGTISDAGRNSAQPPNGSGDSSLTVVRALHPGSVSVLGTLILGTSKQKASYVAIRDITFEGGGVLYNTSYLVIQRCGFHDTSEGGGAVFDIGTNDGEWGNTYNLIEDVWIWGRDRAMAMNYRSDNNVWRRVVIRGDGCSSADCATGNNPNHGIVVYDSAEVSLQNVLVVDRILDGGSGYGDFTTAQHTSGRAFGHIEWLGTISLHSEDACYELEADETFPNDPTFRLENVVGWDCVDTGVNTWGIRATRTDLVNATFFLRGGNSAAVRIPAGQTAGTIKRVIVAGADRLATDIGYPFTYFDTFGNWSDGVDRDASCSAGCRTTDPLHDGSRPSLRYVLRIEPDSPLHGAGDGGSDIGANVTTRYGADGTYYGQPRFNELTSVSLWPWPNEDRIKRDLCTNTGETRGFCSKSSLTDYVWTYLGNAAPSDVGQSSNGVVFRRPPIPIPFLPPVMR